MLMPPLLPCQHSTVRGGAGNILVGALVSGANEDLEGKHYLHADLESSGRGGGGQILHSRDVSRDGSRELKEGVRAVSQERLG